MDEHSGAHPAVVAVDDLDRICGFGSLSPYRPRPAYRTTRRRLGLRRRRGAEARASAGACSTELVAAGGRPRLSRRHGSDRRGHEASIGLHRACGFELVGVEREVGRKFGRWLDVVLMQHLDRPG